MASPMDGLRVLDLSRLLPGAFATQLLADLGAEVIKVEEPPRGDYMREAPPRTAGVSHPFLLVNQGKKSLALNLKTEEGRELFHRLVPTADVLIEQFRPGVAKRLGVAYEDVADLREGLVYCSLSGYGAEGPYRDRPAHDLNFDALAGLLHMNALNGRPVIPATTLADIGAGMLAAYAILAALLARERTGRGAHLDLSIYDAAVHLNLLNIAEVFGGGDPRPGETLLTGGVAYYDVYETADGRFVTLAAIEEKFWDRFCELVGREDLKEKHTATGGEAAAVREVLQDLFRGRTLAEWNDLLEGEDVAYAPVLTTAEAVKDPHFIARRLAKEVELSEGRFRALTHPVRWTPEGPARRGGAPKRGEHTAEILQTFGLAGAEVVDLAERGVVGLSE